MDKEVKEEIEMIMNELKKIHARESIIEAHLTRHENELRILIKKQNDSGKDTIDL